MSLWVAEILSKCRIYEGGCGAERVGFSICANAMPVSTSNIAALLPLSVILRVHVAHMCTCICGGCLYSKTYERSAVCRISPIEEAQRRGKGGGRDVKE